MSYKRKPNSFGIFDRKILFNSVTHNGSANSRAKNQIKHSDAGDVCVDPKSAGWREKKKHQPFCLIIHSWIPFNAEGNYFLILLDI